MGKTVKRPLAIAGTQSSKVWMGIWTPGTKAEHFPLMQHWPENKGHIHI